MSDSLMTHQSDFHFTAMQLLHTGLILTSQELEIFTIVRQMILISLIEQPEK